MSGYEKLKKSVLFDIEREKNGGIFNSDGCNECVKNICTHRPCSKFKWVIDRAKHYEEKTSINWNTILDKWEDGRTYWYQNYYQDSQQPELNLDGVYVYETKRDFSITLLDEGFRCPYCKGISTNPNQCNSGKLVKLMNKKGKKPCNWVSWGLMGTLGNGITIFIKETLELFHLFYPVAWESKLNKENSPSKVEK